MTMMSSIHYGLKFNNAMWNGSQMLYGDGDGSLFVDFTNGNDVIGHELTHGVTQHSLQLAYAGDAGGLNESMSDCFGSMFRQWEAKQNVQSADWLIGYDIMGPTAKAKGFTCLGTWPIRRPSIAWHPSRPNIPRSRPHRSALFERSAQPCVLHRLQGARRNSWEKIGQVWYRSLTGFGPPEYDDARICSQNAPSG